MPEACVFCGSLSPLTREHVIGAWVSKIGLDPEPVPHAAGPLNRLPREMGTRPPYQQTVKNFCASCNNGWMSQLETVAQRVLKPLILGEPGTIAAEDQAAVAMWAQKTVLTAMLVSSEEQRAGGYGLPLSEYQALYAGREQVRPLGATQFWVGRYDGDPGYWAIRATPVAVRISGVPETDLPQGYLMTIVLGQLILHGLRFTTPALQVDAIMGLSMPMFWPPSTGPARWPAGEPCTPETFLRLADGKMLRSCEEHMDLRPWRPATDLPQSQLVGGAVELPTLCGEHSVFYPYALVEEAARGRFYAFIPACECPMGYLIETESDGAHCKSAGETAMISELYESLVGEEVIVGDDEYAIHCKLLPGEAQRVCT